ncbi:MAG TPA: hypothetical protein VHQ01_04475, partial [Pyrinomonadaceae bacterium]|nr:hypothetical protein [Pyrinomonadaceae bacterium]
PASIKLEAETKKNKERILKIGLSKDVTIHRRGGGDLVGTITEIKDESVVVRDADLRANADIRYEQIKNVEKGYSDARGINGQRIPPKKRRIGLIIVGAVAAGVAVFIISVLRDPNF